MIVSASAVSGDRFGSYPPTSYESSVAMYPMFPFAYPTTIGVARSAMIFSSWNPYSTIGSPGIVSSKYGPIRIAIISHCNVCSLPGSSIVLEAIFSG